MTKTLNERSADVALVLAKISPKTRVRLNDRGIAVETPAEHAERVRQQVRGTHAGDVRAEAVTHHRERRAGLRRVGALMTTLNAKANAAYHALIDEYEREHPDGVWMGFDNQRDAYEQGWEDGHEARAVPDRATLARAAAKAILYNLPIDAFGDEKRFKDYAAIWGNATADAVLSLLNGTES